MVSIPGAAQEIRSMRRVALALLSASLFLALAGPVAASGPVITTIPVDDTAVFPAGTRCPFELHGARTGTLTIKQWFDESGTLVRETDTWSSTTIVWSNPLTGKSFTVLLAGPFIYEDNGDGTGTVWVPGNDQAIIVKGEGFLVGRTGLVVYTVDSTTGAILDLLLSAGHQDALWPAGCAVLE
jgi:hypothetical protein